MKPPLSPQIDMTEIVKPKDSNSWITQLTAAGKAEAHRRETAQGLIKEVFQIGNGLTGYRYVRKA